MSNTYNQRPSSMLYIDDPYTAYCLDEACALIVNRIKSGESPTFVKKYKSFSDMYKDYR